MKLLWLILVLFPFCGYGQNSLIYNQDKFKRQSDLSNIPNYSLSCTILRLEHLKTEIKSGLLFLSMINPTRQLNLYDQETIISNNYWHNKTFKILPYKTDLVVPNNIMPNHKRTLKISSDTLTKTVNALLNQQIHGFVSVGLIATTNNIMPFWMRSMQYGSIPLDGLSTSVIGGALKDYDSLQNHKLFDWGSAVEARVNVGNTTQTIILEAYVKGRMGIFQLKAGRSKEFMGLVDSTMSSGAFAISGTALGIPKIELSVPEYWSLPYTNGLFAFKGNFAHGWMGDQMLRTTYPPGFRSLLDRVGSYYHQKSLYGRLGKLNWHLKFYGGFNHQVMWGNEPKIFPWYKLSSYQNYIHVILGQGYEYSRVGNAVGSIDQGMEIKLKNILLTGYHQFFYDAGALRYLANAKDGLWGLSIKNMDIIQRNFIWKKILIELIYSKSQGGEPNSRPRNSAAEDYYNNALYERGWTYNDLGMGNPLFTTKRYIHTDLPSNNYDYFINNRIIALHTGTEFSYSHWNYKTMLTYSANYGNWNNMPATRTWGSIIQYNSPPYFNQVGQFSGYFEASHPLKKGYAFSFAFAADQGKLIYNSVGGFIKITRSW